MNLSEIDKIADNLLENIQTYLDKDIDVNYKYETKTYEIKYIDESKVYLKINLNTDTISIEFNKNLGLFAMSTLHFTHEKEPKTKLEYGTINNMEISLDIFKKYEEWLKNKHNLNTIKKFKELSSSFYKKVGLDRKNKINHLKKF